MLTKIHVAICVSFHAFPVKPLIVLTSYFVVTFLMGLPRCDKTFGHAPLNPYCFLAFVSSNTFSKFMGDLFKGLTSFLLSPFLIHWRYCSTKLLQAILSSCYFACYSLTITQMFTAARGILECSVDVSTKVSASRKTRWAANPRYLNQCTAVAKDSPDEV